jgi:hypothetical protein
MNLLKEKNAGVFYIGCSGAFTIEGLILRNLFPKKIVSSDVSIFTNAVGFYLSDQDFDIKINNYPYLDKYLEMGLVYKTAVVLYLQDLADYISANNKHKVRMLNNYFIQHDQIISSKVKRLEEHKADFSSVNFQYFPQDVVDFVERVEKDSLFVAFPPFWVSGYEKLYKFINDTIISEKLRPEYKIFDNDSLKLMIEKLKASGANFIVGTNKGELFSSDTDLHLVAYDYFSKNELVHFVTNFSHESIFARQNADFISATYGVEIGDETDFEQLSLKDKIDIKEIPLDLFDSVRLSRLSKNIQEPAQPTTKFGVFRNERLIGVFGIDVQSMKMKEDGFYLMADLPVVNTKDSAKLISALATSRVVRKFLKGKYLVDYPIIRTTAFTKKPTSMKYRNFWKVSDRNVQKSFINYVADMGRYHKKDIIQKWISLQKKKDQ